MNRTVTIREATKADWPKLALLRWDSAKKSRKRAALSRKTFVSDFSTFLAESMKQERWKIWVAEFHGRIVGNLYVASIAKVPRPNEFRTRFGYMTGVYVKADERNRGIGSMLVKAADKWADSAGLEFVVVWPSNKSIPFYGRHGYKRGTAIERKRQRNQAV